MRWASYCCPLPVPRASNSYQWPALFANDLCTKTLAKQRKQRAKQRMSARVQRRKRSPRPARLRRGKGEGRRHRTRTGCGGGTELSWGTWHTSPFARGILCPHVWASAVTAHSSPTPPPISSICPQLHPAARQAVVLCRGMPRPC